MGIESTFLRELPGLGFMFLGICAQLYLSRVFSIPRMLLRLALLLEGLIFLLGLEPINQRFKMEAFSSSMLLCWWAMIPFAAIIWLSRRLPATRFDPERREMLRKALTVAAAAPAVALGAGIIIRKNLTVSQTALKFAKLPKDLVGLRLVQLSDIHMGTFYSRSDLARAVDAANELRGALVFVTGDLITDRFDPLDTCLLELKRLRAESGIWGCMGNHEMHANVERHAAHRGRECGIEFLRQQSKLLTFGNAKLNLAGVDHQRRDRPYLKNAESLKAAGAFNLLLSHNPDVFPVAAKQGFDLTLAGHTHGGQINFEIGAANYNVADLVTPYTKGAYQLGDSSLYVNSGLGTIGVPVRLGAPPEVTLITLCDS